MNPFAVVLGIAQDGGHPQPGCRLKCCAASGRGDSRRHLQSCVGIVDPASGERWLLDATPSLPEQLARLDHEAAASLASTPLPSSSSSSSLPDRAPACTPTPTPTTQTLAAADQLPTPTPAPTPLSGILLTHAHFGHYTGLLWLGREVMNTRAVPVFVMPRMAQFLTHHGPWSQLVELRNIQLIPVNSSSSSSSAGDDSCGGCSGSEPALDMTSAVCPSSTSISTATTITTTTTATTTATTTTTTSTAIRAEAAHAVMLNSRLRATALVVPHRDEFSETVAWKISGPHATVLYLPDIDSWEQWDLRLEEVLADVDVAWLDGTFFADGELQRDMREIPHPRIADTMARLSASLPLDQRRKVRFIHLNHTNPALDPQSPQARSVVAAGMAIAAEGERVRL